MAISKGLSIDHPIVGLPLLWKAIETMRGAITISDCQQPDNPLIYANQAFYELTGYGPDEVIGHNCRFLQKSDTSKAAVAKLRKAMHDGESVRTTIKNYRKDGTSFWNDLTISPVQDADGRVTHMIGIQVDVTEQINFNESLQKNQAELIRSNKELEQFTYAASHDLQEPLRMVSSYLQLIKSRYLSQLDDTGVTFFNFASEGAERMQALVNDLLTLSRVRTTAKEFKKESIESILETVLLNLKISILESKAQITHDELPEMVVDRSQINQLLQNLISNAIKYRKPGSPVKIHISATRRAKEYVFSVSDDGIGIEHQYQERIFQVFQRLHTRSEYPGNGVGLAICSKIIERHGGKIWVKSIFGNGAIFYFTLPIKREKHQ